MEISPEKKATIQENLTITSINKDVIVLYACESGSRAWGFPSKDSDYDVRFIYLNRPEWYLSISEGRDVIEKNVGNIDLVGWDFRKALRLFRKSNPALLEWLKSPIVYRDKFDIASAMREFMDKYYSPTACSYHYVHMAKGNFKDYLKADTVWVKKYFYVLRPLLAVMWIRKYETHPPIRLDELIEGLGPFPYGFKSELRELIRRKKEGSELDWEHKNHVISNFIEQRLDHELNTDFNYPNPGAPDSLLDTLFIDALMAVYELTWF